jgi:hypothetical protein
MTHGPSVGGHSSRWRRCGALVEDETGALLAALTAGEIDVALIGLGPYDHPPHDRESLLVAREPVAVAGTPNCHAACATAGMPSRVGETGDQTGQESRSAGHRAAASLTVMDVTIHSTFLPHNDPDASLACYRDTLGFEVRNNVGHNGLR